MFVYYSAMKSRNLYTYLSWSLGLLIILICTFNILNFGNNFMQDVGTNQFIQSPSEDTMRIRATVKRLPQVILIGQKKCGTVTLKTFLQINPQISVQVKEIDFFSLNYDKGLEWYRQQMLHSSPDQLTLEGSPRYFYTPEVPGRVKAMNSRVKLLLILRDPVTRLISDYDHERSFTQGSFPDFEKIIFKNGTINFDYHMVQNSIYHKYLSNWMRHFPASSFLILDGESLAKYPVPELQRVESFLGLQNYITERDFTFDQDKGFYCRKKTGNVECLGPEKGRKHKTYSREVLEVLRKFYKPHNEKLVNMTGLQFDWLL